MISSDSSGGGINRSSLEEGGGVVDSSLSSSSVRRPFCTRTFFNTTKEEKSLYDSGPTMMMTMMMNAVTQRDLSHEFETFENRASSDKKEDHHFYQLFRNDTTKTKTLLRKRFVFDPFCNDFEERGHLHNDGFRAFEEKTMIARNGVEVVRQCDASLQGNNENKKQNKKRIFLGFQKFKKKKKKKRGGGGRKRDTFGISIMR